MEGLGLLTAACSLGAMRKKIAEIDFVVLSLDCIVLFVLHDVFPYYIAA